VLAAASVPFAVWIRDVEAALFADLPGGRIVVLLIEVSSQDAALRVNLAISRSLLARATTVVIQAEGSIRPWSVPQLRGLLCTVRQDPSPTIEISGPLAVFRRTLVYGRALGELLSFLTGTARFELHGRCLIAGQEGTLSTLGRRDRIPRRAQDLR
jgi:predicted nuclease of restriction endonuclease-like RecB superfamily